MSEVEELKNHMRDLIKEYENLQSSHIHLQEGYKTIFSENLSLKDQIYKLKSQLEK